jgi:hypothetical protein
VESFLAVGGAAVEVIVVDDASFDNSVECVAALGRPEVIIERLESNHGAGIARNQASNAHLVVTHSFSMPMTRFTRRPLSRRSKRSTPPAPTWR